MPPEGFDVDVRRGVVDSLKRALGRHPVVVLLGPDKVGKSAIARRAFPEGGCTVSEFAKNDVARQAASADPISFVSRLSPGTVLDDAHLVPELISLLARLGERLRAPGTVLAVATRSRLSRAQIAELRNLPVVRVASLTQSELRDRVGRFIPAALTGDPGLWPFEALSVDNYLDQTLAGGLPGLTGVADPVLRLEGYSRTLEQLFAQAGERHSPLLRRLFGWVLARPGNLIQDDRDATELGLRPADLVAGLEELESLGLLRLSQQWTRFRRSDGAVRAYARDGGFLNVALGGDAAMRLSRPAPLPVLRTMVAHELYAQNEWSRHPAQVSFWRSKPSQYDIDFLLEDDDGAVVPVQVSSSIAPGAGEFAGIDAFRRRHPRAYRRGLILYPGDRVRSMTDDRWAVPLSVLWTVADQEVPLDIGSLDIELQAAASALQALVDRASIPDALLAEKRASIEMAMRTSLEPRLQRISLVLGSLGFGVETVTPVSHPTDPGAMTPAWFDGLRDTLNEGHGDVVATIISGLEIRPAGADPAAGTRWMAFVAAVLTSQGDLLWSAGHALRRSGAAGGAGKLPDLVGFAGPLPGRVGRVEEALFDQLSAALAAALPDALNSLSPAA